MNNVITEWTSMTDTQQLDLIERCITKAARQEGLYAYDVAEHIGGTWERLTVNLQPATLDKINATRTAQDKQPITPVSMVYRAARASIAVAMYDKRKHSGEISTRSRRRTAGGCRSRKSVFAGGGDMRRSDGRTIGLFTKVSPEEKAVIDKELMRVEQVYDALSTQSSQMQMDADTKNASRKLAQEVVCADGLTTALTDALIERVYVYPGNRLDIDWKPLYPLL